MCAVREQPFKALPEFSSAELPARGEETLSDIFEKVLLVSTYTTGASIFSDFVKNR